MSGSTVILALAGRGRDPVAHVDGSITDSDSVETRRTVPVATAAPPLPPQPVGDPMSSSDRETVTGVGVDEDADWNELDDQDESSCLTGWG
jgi:hypothetical protein